MVIHFFYFFSLTFSDGFWLKFKTIGLKISSTYQTIIQNSLWGVKMGDYEEDDSGDSEEYDGYSDDYDDEE